MFGPKSARLSQALQSVRPVGQCSSAPHVAPRSTEHVEESGQHCRFRFRHTRGTISAEAAAGRRRSGPPFGLAFLHVSGRPETHSSDMFRTLSNCRDFQRCASFTTRRFWVSFSHTRGLARGSCSMAPLETRRSVVVAALNAQSRYLSLCVSGCCSTFECGTSVFRLGAWLKLVARPTQVGGVLACHQAMGVDIRRGL